MRQRTDREAASQRDELEDLSCSDCCRHRNKTHCGTGIIRGLRNVSLSRKHRKALEGLFPQKNKVNYSLSVPKVCGFNINTDSLSLRFTVDPPDKLQTLLVAWK